MGSSLTTYVFYGMKLPNFEDSDNPRPRFNDSGIEALRNIGREADDSDLYPDLWWELEKLFPQLDIVHVGVYDYTTPHIAIKATVKRDWDGDLIALKELPVDLMWEATLQEALKYLKWVTVSYDEDGKEQYTDAEAPTLEVGWWVGANWG